MKDIIVTLTLMPWCEPPERERDMEAEWEEANRKILLEAAQGKSFDAEGNPIPALSYCDGVTTYYGLDLFGELIITRREVDEHEVTNTP